MNFAKYKRMLDIMANFAQHTTKNVWEIFLWQEHALNQGRQDGEYIQPTVLKTFDDWKSYSTEKNRVSINKGAESILLSFEETKGKFFDVSQTNYYQNPSNKSLAPSKFQTDNSITTAFWHRKHLLNSDRTKLLSEFWRNIINLREIHKLPAKNPAESLTNASLRYLMFNYFGTAWGDRVDLETPYNDFHEDLVKLTELNEDSVKNVVFDGLHQILLDKIAEIENKSKTANLQGSSFFMKKFFYDFQLDTRVIGVETDGKIVEILPYKFFPTDKNDEFLRYLQEDCHLPLANQHTIIKNLRKNNIVKEYAVIGKKYIPSSKYRDKEWNHTLSPEYHELKFIKQYSSKPKPKALKSAQKGEFVMETTPPMEQTAPPPVPPKTEPVAVKPQKFAPLKPSTSLKQGEIDIDYALDALDELIKESS
ncbi:MAG: hypothetical protein FWG65_13245 [Turicibacter sp.]|nr:hypothetical protein [Turicibacter sp.]